jgi:MFS transporter, ACDE family, multidrug resistance protein
MRAHLMSITRFLHRPPAPGVLGFAVIAGFEAVVRGIVLAVYPLVMYRAWGDAVVVSKWYFGVGVFSLLTALTVPMLTRYLPRRWVYTLGLSLYLLSAVFGMVGGKATTAALVCHAMAAATAFVCFNAYVLDHVAKPDFGRLESLRLLYGGVGWTAGPVLGVWLMQFWSGAPFVIVALGAMGMLGLIWRMRLGNARVHLLANNRKASHNPLVFLRRFFSQPRLVAGWFFTVMRSCGWWLYIVYVGIFAVQNGLGDQVGGLATSLANAGLFLAPLMLRWIQRRSVRRAVRTGFLLSGICFILGALVSPLPWATVAMLVLGSVFLVLLDVCGGLPFLMSVKPSQRTEMSAVYSSFRDVSGILSPAWPGWRCSSLQLPVCSPWAGWGCWRRGAWPVICIRSWVCQAHSGCAPAAASEPIRHESARLFHSLCLHGQHLPQSDCAWCVSAKDHRSRSGRSGTGGFCRHAQLPPWQPAG